jgi:hypothetical protein
MFDRLETQYLDSRQAELRNRRQSADQRRSDESLSASERAEAAEVYDLCKSALQQIERFQEAMQNLIKGKSRSWGPEDRELAKELEQEVEQFRKATEEKLQLYEQLIEKKGREKLEETFSSSFINNLKQYQEDWISSLEDLESAAESYQKQGDEPVKAHHYDLFIYFGDDLKGSVWPTSTGILSIGYYPKKKAGDLLNEQNQPKDSITNEESNILAQIATEFEQYELLADEIDSKCKSLAKKISSDWFDRALSEITNGGYQPNHKHGVEINITPLAEAEIVPETVDKRVI